MEKNKTPFGMPSSGTLLRTFVAHLGATTKEVSEMYGVPRRTLTRWMSSSKSGAPDLKNHTQLLVDLFGWYLRISPDKLKRKQSKNRVQELAQTKESLDKFRKYLGLTKKRFLILYQLNSFTGMRWLETANAGAPDLKNHPVLLRDFFRWYFENKLEEGKQVLEVLASNAKDD